MNHTTQRGSREREASPSFAFFKLALKASTSFHLVPVSVVVLHMFKGRRGENLVDVNKEFHSSVDSKGALSFAGSVNS